MSKKAKSINLFLMDGEPTGRIKSTIANWTGVAYKLPRMSIDKCKDRIDLSQSGVYFLLGTETEQDVVYIGQAGVRKNNDGILCRLLEHKRNIEKSYWNEAIVLTTSNNSFGPTEISYLENRFYNIAVEANRVEVKNNVEPTAGNITEEKECELEEFINSAKILVGTLGYRFLEPLIDETTEENIEEKILYLTRKSKKSGKEIKAMCRQTNEGFIVLKGSMIETIDSESIPKWVQEKRKVMSVSAEGILLENVATNSPSYAACLVIGGHVNGPTSWKNTEGKTLKEIEQQNDL